MKEKTISELIKEQDRFGKTIVLLLPVTVILAACAIVFKKIMFLFIALFVELIPLVVFVIHTIKTIEKCFKRVK